MYTFSFFFFTDTATTEIYTLSLHDALPISEDGVEQRRSGIDHPGVGHVKLLVADQVGRLLDEVYTGFRRSEEHTSELQSRPHLVCRLLLEKKKRELIELSDKRKELDVDLMY